MKDEIYRFEGTCHWCGKTFYTNKATYDFGSIWNNPGWYAECSFCHLTVMVSMKDFLDCIRGTGSLNRTTAL